MKDWSYYSTRTLTYPRRDDFGKVFVYRAGKTVYEGDLATWESVRKNYAVGYTVEKVHDHEAFLAARQAYAAEGDRLIEEFKRDLRVYHDVEAPAFDEKFQKAFALAWQYGHSGGYAEVANYFDDLVELIK